MVFFQAVLLAGYAYAHATASWLGVRRQVMLHIALLALPFVVLPISLGDWLPPASTNPIPWALALLFLRVGLPFFVLSATAPLMQKWFVYTGHPSSKDPYFLYAASNFGSMIALLAYPALIEPVLPLKPDHWLSQSILWAVGYGLLVLLLIGCAWFVWRSPQLGKEWERESVREWPNGRLEGQVSNAIETSPTHSPSDSPSLALSHTLTRLRWIALAFVPSSLMLGVTTHITLDIAAIPLLWVIPLALYLLSFILVFARWPEQFHRVMVLAMPLLLLLVIFTEFSKMEGKIVVSIVLELLTLFVVALVCHGELARSRPETGYLTEFYLLMSVGGVLGGIFNALVAPVIFSTTVEYYLAMVFACMLLPRIGPLGNVSFTRFFLEFAAQRQQLGPIRPAAQRVLSWLDSEHNAWRIIPLGLIFDIAVAGFIGGLTYWLLNFVFPDNPPVPSTFQAWVIDKFDNLSDRLDLKRRYLKGLLAYGLPILLCYLCVLRPFRFGLAVGAFMLGAVYGFVDPDSELVLRKRSFFGVLTVRHDRKYDSYSLSHGTTLHGQQTRSHGLQHEPLTYYHKTGPIGQLFESLHDNFANQNLAFIGLGTGSLACYGEPGQHLTFYDIDPTVVYIARDSGNFTYLAECRAPYDIVLGDARLRMADALDAHYKLIVVDAFNSDAIPIHLITREAIELYLRKLAGDGILAVHISNRHLDLRPVLANIAESLGLACIREADKGDDEIDKSPSDWVLLAPKESNFGKLQEDISAYWDDDDDPVDNKRWRRLPVNPKVGLWTDDFSNILSVFMW
jgi:hypothetical protein